ncbi:rhombosortase [Shewanella gelidimarina]|uniref:rhombosortase n=1 Tax=Shewanella gelidimarina TaxID=56813 RepID=UPI00200EACE7|nr:rhombosortase [Shewanella gelidimarina]MCL1059209.1 rhombosortase [Shewanella gelidimarina]
MVKSPYAVAAIISIICIALFYLGLDDLLAYRRDLIFDGQWWRLLTGNFLHTNAWHLFMNLAGLWVILLLHEQHYRARSLAVIIIVVALSLMQGVGLLLFFPETKGYVGLSGMLHGLFVYGAVLDITKGLKTGYLLTLGVILKVIYEQTYGASSEVTALIGARVATEAHFVGLVSGFICLGSVYAVRKLKK